MSAALTTVLDGMSQAIAEAEALGRRLVVWNPSNPDEDLSEGWDNDREAYEAFKAGIGNLRRTWARVFAVPVNVNKILEELFGEPVKAAVLNRAQRLQEARRQNNLGIASTGLIGSMPASIPVKPNTFYGEN